MHLSAPIYKLRREAKLLARAEQIPLYEAQGRIANREGFPAWSILVANEAQQSPAQRVFGAIEPGELVLVAGRPGQGKTLLALELAALSIGAGRPATFFTLEFTVDQCRAAMKDVGYEHEQLEIDCSNWIDSGSIQERLQDAPAGSLAVIDYLQLLDQRRETPCLQDQVQSLRDFARRKKLILVFISQVDRAFDTSESQHPALKDIYLPNPLDLALFDKACFLHEGRIKVQTVKALR